MKNIKVTITFPTHNHVTLDFIKEYFEKIALEKIHNPTIIEVEESAPDSEKL